jgi:hypothetical protein
MRIVDGKALLLKLRNPKRVTETIPKSKTVQDHEVLVKWGIDEAHTLGQASTRRSTTKRRPLPF